MKILLLAPQPFYTERGTPIVVDLLLKTFSRRGDQVDVLTYPFGKDVEYPGVKIYRIPKVPLIRGVTPGFSWRKVLYDFLMFLTVLPFVLRKRYQVVHAVEEAVFIAMILKAVFGIQYIYDMDSSLVQQMVDRYPRLFTPFCSILTYFEGLAIRNALAVVPVCEALSDDIQKFRPNKVMILHDVSLLTPPNGPPEENLREKLNIEGALMMYVGNLEPYQGIDLLLESFALALQRAARATLVIIGGSAGDIARYQKKAADLGIAARVHFLGPKPVERLADYLAQADILVSPRIRGNNTPMKVYSYLDSGKPLLATDLPTHTQVLNSQVAVLAQPRPSDFSRGVLKLVEDKELRQRIGLAGKKLVAERHTYKAFCDSLFALYEWIDAHSLEADRRLDLFPLNGNRSKKEMYG